MITRNLTCFILALAPLVSVADAAVVVEYGFNGISLNGATATSAATVTAANATAADAVWAGYTNPGFSAASGTAFISSGSTGAAVVTTQYLELTVTATAGYQLNLTSVSFDLGGTNSNTTTAYTVNSVVRSNAEAVDYSTNLTNNTGFDVASVSIPANVPTTPVLTNYTIDLSGATYQGLNTITFRVYFYDDASSNLTDRLGSFIINGDIVAVPEPTTIGLLMSGLFVSGILLRSRRSMVTC